MSPRSTSWIAIAALFAAAAALALAVVATMRASDDEPAVAAGSTMEDMGHGAAAPTEGVPDATATRGGEVLEPRVESGVWVYELQTKPVRWEILPGTKVTAYTYNGTVPGPEIRVPYGQRVRILVKNDLPDPTTVHWHGIAVPNAMDGVPGVTQDPIEPGETFTYEFDAIPAGRDSKGGTFLYHSHFEEDRQVGLGLAGALVIEEPDTVRYDVERTIMINEWALDTATGETRPPMEMEGSLPNFFTLNGRSFPATETIEVRRGDRVLLRLVGAGQFEHPMHLHGTDFRIVAKDGHPVEQPLAADVVQVAPGERYDIAFTATEPGKWVFHCHIGHHLTNDGDDPGGLILVVDVT
ncbi:MAG TPA: copper oxidase [Gaiellaceae bacterium]|nr:copper oxidase [Gaiellaceae bacterium]